MSDIEIIPPQSLGGTARAKKLSPEERSDIARAAAEARWAQDPNADARPSYPKATHEGPLQLGGMSIDCAVLEDGSRVLSRAGFVRAIGRKGKVKGGEAYAPESKLPIFLAADNLKPFITKGLTDNSNPVYFKMKQGGVAMGYKAQLLADACEVFLSARDAGALRGNQIHIAKQCEVLVRGFARVGIAALVDEATGYQEVRDRLALQEILRHYISGALLEWSKTFPDEFYKEMFRLRKWEFNYKKRFPLVGKLTKDLVYQRLAPGVLRELESKNPITEKGYRRHKHFQWLTKDVGHPALSKHLFQLIGMMSACDSWEQFKKVVDRKLPKLNSTLPLALDE